MSTRTLSGGVVEGVVGVVSGLLRGALEGGIWVFRGIPYAASPSGDSRWRRAVDPGRWMGVRDASGWGPIAPQSPPAPGLSILGDPTASDEDCLNLNLWSPGLDDRRRPVIVWVHGGGFTTGTGASAIYSGDRLARSGAVVVTINYRLGALGFLAHPELMDDERGGCGNWGLSDQLAALEWVQENVASFGGDPDNVTVVGESAGAMSICALLASDACGRTFHRAVVESGPPVTASVEWGARRAERLSELAGVPVNREALTAIDSAAFVKATELLATQLPADGSVPLPLMPVVGEGLVASEPAAAVDAGATARVPLLIGTTRDEAALFLATDRSVADMDTDRVIRAVAKILGEEAARHIVGSYARARESRRDRATPGDVFIAITSDYVFRLPTLSLAVSSTKHQPSTFVYLFNWESPFLGGVFGSPHGLEIPFVFGTVDDARVAAFTGGGPEAHALTTAMQQAWIAFATTGDPSCDALGDWPGYEPLRRPTMVLGAWQGVVDDPGGSERRAWEEAGLEIPGGHHHVVPDDMIG